MKYIFIPIILIAALFLYKLLFHKNSAVNLEKKTVQISGQKFELFVADDIFEEANGLMFVKELEDNEGMIFLFSDKRKQSFWNKNTLIDLTVLWIDGDTIVGIDKLLNEPEHGRMNIESNKDADKVIELPLKAFSKYKIEIGDKIEL